MSDRTILFANIPSPAYIEYLTRYEPHELQLVDQALAADWLVSRAYRAGLTLDYFATYDIWHPGDYQMMIFRKPRTFSRGPVPARVRKPRLVTRLLRRLFGR
jgi:hypothetical protein